MVPFFELFKEFEIRTWDFKVRQPGGCQTIRHFQKQPSICFRTEWNKRGNFFAIWHVTTACSGAGSVYTVLINARTHVATFTFPVLLHHPQWNEKILKEHSNSYQSDCSKTIYELSIMHHNWHDQVWTFWEKPQKMMFHFFWP